MLVERAGHRRPGRAELAGSRTTWASPTACPAPSSPTGPAGRRAKFGAEVLTARDVRRRWRRAGSAPGRAVRRRHARSPRTPSSSPPASSYRALDGAGRRRADRPRRLLRLGRRPRPPTCAGQDVYIVGGANSAGQAAVFFSRHAQLGARCWCAAPSLEASMSHYLIEQLDGDRRTSRVRTCTEVVEAHGDDHLEQLDAARRATTGEQETVDAGHAVRLHRRRTAHRLARRRRRPRRARLRPHRPGPARRRAAARAAGRWTATRTTWSRACPACSWPATCGPTRSSGWPRPSARARWPSRSCTATWRSR